MVGVLSRDQDLCFFLSCFELADFEAMSINEITTGAADVGLPLDFHTGLVSIAGSDYRMDRLVVHSESISERLQMDSRPHVSCDWMIPQWQHYFVQEPSYPNPGVGLSGKIDRPSLDRLSSASVGEQIPSSG